MAVSMVAYCTREDTQRATDFANTVISNGQIDRAIQSAARNIEAHLHRDFYPNDTTRKFDWPDYSYAPPWKLRFGRWDLVSATQVTSGGVTIPLNQIIFRPYNRPPGEPYTELELDLSTTAAFRAAATPQLSVAITGTWGYTADTDPAGTLPSAINNSVTTVAVSDGSQLGVGDLMIIGTERMLVTEKAATATGLTQATGLTTDSASDNQLLTTTGSGTLNVGEVILLGAERMLITDITGTVATVKRAWDGTVLATHTTATVNAYRSLTVLRGQLGTAAASHAQNDAISRHRPPALIRDLAIAESVNRVLQETSGYARTVGGPDMAMPAPGIALSDLWAEAVAKHGRQVRMGAI